jgi:hypothetical protein
MAIRPASPMSLSTCRSALLALALAGCAGGGGLDEKAADPNVYPTGYRAAVLAYLQLNPSEMENVNDALISAPALAPIAGSQRYLACLRLVGRDSRQDKAVVFFSGQINQFVDASSQQCGAAAYQPFTELVSELRTMRGKK